MSDATSVGTSLDSRRRGNDGLGGRRGRRAAGGCPKPRADHCLGRSRCCAAPMAPAIIRGSPEGFRRLARPSRGSTPPRGASKPTEIPMPSVKVRENEPFEFALRRFKRTCEKEIGRASCRDKGGQYVSIPG